MLKEKLTRIVACTAVVVGLVVPAFAQGPPEISFPTHVGISPPMRDVVAPPVFEQKGAPPINPLPRLAGTPQFDPVLQNTSGPATNTFPGQNFDGVAVGPPGCNCAPPDTNMAVGPNHVVQWVNTAWAVYSKSGVIEPGYPKAGNSFWAGFNNDCETHNDGDPIIQYDRLADRWIATQFAINTPFGPYSQCFAVSTTGNPSGTYTQYRYTFTSDPNDLNDYPKMGVWPVSFTGSPSGAYFMSYNMFQFAFSFVGAKACAYDRGQMIAGASAAQICFQAGPSYGFISTDLDGPAAPAAETPGLFFDFGSNALLMWKFTPNFATPASSSFSGPTTISAAAFSAACGGGGTCIPQSETTQQLDSLADRLMYRNAYRAALGDHDAVFISHSVTAGSSVGPRWYEIRNPTTGTPTIFQQGTFAPDSTFRWMPSIASDQAGNIALGYSASSSAMHPAIRFTGREPGDTAGDMQAETNIFSGTGSQTGLSRWGDYSAMRIDPADDCTFWYTTEYIPSNGGFNWKTRIASFKFASCGLPPPPPTPPLPPSLLTATAASCNRINLSWQDNSNNEANFDIERCTGDAVTCLAGPFGPLASVGANTTTYSDTTVAPSTDYTYRVKASNTAGDSPYSNNASAKTTASASPTAPSNLNASAVSATQINLSWSDNSDNEDGFKIERCQGAGCTEFAQIATVGANVTTYNNTGLADGTTYRYQVKAFSTNCGGDSDPSNPAEATTPLAAPTNLTATAAKQANNVWIDLSWTDNSSTNTGNTIERCQGSGCTNFAFLATVGDVSSYRDNTVARRTTYTYHVRATKAGVPDSANSNNASATTR